MNERKERKPEMKTQVSRILLMVMVAGALMARGVVAQDEQKGIDQGNYNIKQSVEFGYRFTDLNGSLETYDTMVNLQSGFRLLGFTTEMRSLDQHATFFDRLYFSNFGYGGDPNNVSQLRIAKNKWYEFNGMYRQDQNYWDYSLLANPLNPPTVPGECAGKFQSDRERSGECAGDFGDWDQPAQFLYAAQHADVWTDDSAGREGESAFGVRPERGVRAGI